MTTTPTDAQVEAAAQAMWEAVSEGWDTALDVDRDDARAVAREALTAALAVAPASDRTGLTYPCDGACNSDDPHDAHLTDGALTMLSTSTVEDARAEAERRAKNGSGGGPLSEFANGYVYGFERGAERARSAPAPVLPERDTITRALSEVLWKATNHPNPSAVLGRSITPLLQRCVEAVITVLPGRTEATVKAEALREAAEGLSDLLVSSGDTRWHYHLRARADRLEHVARIEAGETR